MPCSSSDGMGDAYREDPEARRNVVKLQDKVTELRRKNDDLTRMLCALLRDLSNVVNVSPDIARWYEEHKAWDRSRGRER
jgi:hypothetical protein